MLAIRATRLFDGVSATPVEQPLLLIDDGTIVAVQSGGEPPSEAEVVEMGRATLVPGLIDAHVHLGFDASPDPVGRLDTVDDDELLDGMRTAAHTALMAGITTVRDLGDRNYTAVTLREELADKPTAGPAVLAAGPPITTPKGHCWYLGGEASGVDGVRAAVRAHADRGVDVIKVMATGGELTPGTFSHIAQFDVEELRVAADEAHRLGLPIAAHAHGRDGIVNAVNAGFDTIEHCSFISADGIAYDPAVLDSIVRAGVAVSTTLGHVPGVPVPPRILALMSQIVPAFQALLNSGATIVCSSDAGIGPAKPHDVLPYAAATMVTVGGGAPVDAMVAMTSVAADACHVGDHKGRLAPGYDADILAVDGDPFTDIHALRSVVAVYRLGERVR